MADQVSSPGERARRRGPSLPIVRPVSQVELSLEGEAHPSFEQVREIALRWVAPRAGGRLPDSAWVGGDFELEDVGAQRTMAIGIEKPRFWAARLDDGDSNVPQRSWVTEVAIAERSPECLLLGARLHCVTRGLDEPYSPSIPSFVRRVVEAFPGSVRVEGNPTRPEATVIRDEHDIDWLLGTILDPQRRLDVIVASLPEGSENLADASIDVTHLHQRLLGAAHVFCVTGPASFSLSDAVGKEFSVFKGAVRTYRPGLDLFQDEPYRHPLALADRIESWAGGGREAFELVLVTNALRRSTSRQDATNRLPPFSQVRRVAAELKRSAAKESDASESDLLALAEEELSALKEAADRDRETYQGLVEQYESERDQALEEAQGAYASMHALRARIRALEAASAEAGAASTSTPIPEDLSQLEDWAREHLAGSVELHNRAFKGAKNSQYEDSSLIYSSLLLLRDQYVPMRRDGGLELKNAFEARCQALGVVEEPTFSGDRYGEEGETYFVRYGGRKRLLDRHLKKGNSREERYCFRLYFFWDEDSEQAVVGWLPSHLDTRLT